MYKTLFRNRLFRLRHFLFRRTYVGAGALALMALAAPAGATEATQVAGPEERYRHLEIVIPESAIADSRWYLSFDNDLLAPKNRDQDYTYGINLAHASRASSNWFLAEWLDAVDGLLRVSQDNRGHGLEVGVYGFTPADVTSPEANPDDRPYASLVYHSVTAESLNWNSQTVIRSQLTLGALGLDVVGDLQNLTHRMSGGHEAEGWHNQISNGGEPTFRYSLSRQQLLTDESSGFESSYSLTASVGYITEAAASIGMRVGDIHTPWHSFKPASRNYGESVSSKYSRAAEDYFWAGLAVKARGYNAFLQGQFRDSVVTYDHDQLRPLIVEAWAGYTHRFVSGYHISYGLRGHTSEIRDGLGDRDVIWGGIMIGRQTL